MSYSFSKTVNEIHLMAYTQDLLDQWAELLASQTEISGTLWLGDRLQYQDKWDLSFWLKRCGESAVQACEYDSKEDELKKLPLIFTPKRDLPSETIDVLPITHKGSKSAFFLDRDGIINTDKAYVYKVDDVEFVAGIVDFIQFLQTQYDYVIVLTNQSGVGRGYYKEEDVKALHTWMAEDLEKSEARINDWYYCPYHPKGEVEQYHRSSYLRKPNSGMALWAARDHDLDLSRCAMVGDKDSDYLVDLQLETYLIQGNYPLKLDLPKFDSLESLRSFLAEKK